jgi:hypothetical protein
MLSSALPDNKHKKEKKEGEDANMMRGLIKVTTEGGAEIFMPKKRNKKVKYPKGYDAEKPGPIPDPERWLPKW